MKNSFVVGILSGLAVGLIGMKIYSDKTNKDEAVAVVQGDAIVSTDITPQNGYTALLQEYNVVIPSPTNLIPKRVRQKADRLEQRRFKKTTQTA